MTEDEFINGLANYYDGTNPYDPIIKKEWTSWLIKQDESFFNLIVLPAGTRPSLEKARDLYRIHHSPLAKALS